MSRQLFLCLFSEMTCYIGNLALGLEYDNMEGRGSGDAHRLHSFHRGG